MKHTRIRPFENLSSANQILCLVFYIPIERPPPQETSNTRIYSETTRVNTWSACGWLRLIPPPKILAIVPEFLLRKDKRVQELCKLGHTSFTRESVIISSIQVLVAEKCPGMNAGTDSVLPSSDVFNLVPRATFS